MEDEWEKPSSEWSSMVQRIGTQFVVNGSPFYVNGFNTYWLMVFAVDPSTKPKVSSLLQEAASVGLTVGRTWAFNDGGWRALQKSPGVYDEDVFKALDFVITEAEKNKIRLILSLVNNCDDYGGKAQYVRWGRCAGLDLNSNDAFFSDPTLKNYFKAHIKAVLTRVITDNCYSFPWFLSFIGTNNGFPHMAFGNLQRKSGHVCLRISQDSTPSHLLFVKQWILAHIQDSEKTLNMPVIFAEFGISEKDEGYDISYREKFMQIVYDNVFTSAKVGGAAGGSLFWQLFPEGTENMSDGFEIVLSKNPSMAKIISEQSNRLSSINSICNWNGMDMSPICNT